MAGRRGRRARAALALAVVAALTPGCGDDRLSRDELIERGDAVCRDFAREAGRGVAIDPKDLRTLVRSLDRQLPAGERALARLRELRPQEDVEPAYRAYLAASERSLDGARAIRDAAADGDRAGVERRLEEALAAEREADARARTVGFAVCGTAT